MHELYIKRHLEDLKPVKSHEITEYDIDNYDVLVYVPRAGYFRFVKFLVEDELITYGCCNHVKIIKKKNFYYYLRKDKIYYLNTYYRYYLHNMKRYPFIRLKDLVEETYKPSRIQHLIDVYNVEIDEIHI